MSGLPPSDVSSSNAQRMLPKSFSPSVNEVMIGRGRKVANHIGNDRFQELIHAQLYDYSRAKTKASKSSIILRVLKAVREGSPVGGFVKQDSKTKRWFTLEDAAARISTAQAFRDALSGNYRSSKQYKQQKRWKSKGAGDDCDESKTGSEESVVDQHYQQPAKSIAFPTMKEEKDLNKEGSFAPMSAMSLFGGSAAAAMQPAQIQQQVQAQQVAQRRRSSMTMTGLKGILDSALDIMDDDDFTFEDNDFFGTKPNTNENLKMHPGNPAMQPQQQQQLPELKDDFHLLLDSFGANVEFTENPFEPTPISAPTSAAPAPTQMPTMNKNWQQSFIPAPTMAPNCGGYPQMQQQQTLLQKPSAMGGMMGAATNDNEFSLRDVLSYHSAF